MTETIAAMYCDGGVIGANPSTVGGTWSYVLVDASGVQVKSESGVWLFAGEPITNNFTEYLAMCKGLAALPSGWSGTVYSDSQITLGRIFKDYQTKGIPERWVIRARQLIGHLGRVEGVLLQGHPTRADLERGVGAKRGYPVSIHNVECDRLCGEQARLYMAKRQVAA